MGLPKFVQRANKARIQNLSQKWKVGYGGLCENPMHQCKALLAIIIIHTHCQKDIQGIKNEIEGRHLKKRKKH